MGVYRGKVLGIRQTSRIERIGEVEGCLPQRSGQPSFRRDRNRFAYLGIAYSRLHHMGSGLLKINARMKVIRGDMFQPPKSHLLVDYPDCRFVGFESREHFSEGRWVQ